MTWLYSIIFAGMMIASGNDASVPNSDPIPETIEIVKAQQDESERFSQTYPLKPNGRVSLSNVNGSVTIEAWDRNEVQVEAVKIADTREALSQVEIIVDAKPDQIEIETDYKPRNYNAPSDRNRPRKLEVNYRLRVPRTAILNEIEVVNGAVTLSNLSNMTKVSAVNGSVNATDLKGTVSLSTVNGEVRAKFDQLVPGSSVSLESVNGKVNLELPSDSNATLKAETMNGSISNELGLPIKKGKYVGQNLYGRIGSGEVHLQLSTVNGGMSVTRKKDGRPLNPVTNLLTTSDEDSDKDLESQEVSRNEAISRRAMAETVRKSVKEKEKAVKDVEKALKAIDLKELKDMKVPDVTTIVAGAIVDGLARTAIIPAGNLWGPSATSIDQRSNSFPVKDVPKVVISAPTCNVQVMSWDQPTVKYVLSEPKSDTRQSLKLNEKIDGKNIALTIDNGKGTPKPVGWGTDRPARLEVYVPRKTDLSVQTEGAIRVQGVSGDLTISGGDHPISIRDAEGRLKLTSDDGLVRVVGFKGDLDLKTADAEVFLEGDFKTIASRADDSVITLTLPATSDASISTNTAIESEGLNIVRENAQTWRLGKGGQKYDFQFSDGSLTLRNLSLIETN